MLFNWKNWCRLCAKDYSNEKELDCNEKFIKDIKNQLEIVNKLYKTSFVPIEDTRICFECSSLLEKLEPFYDRCLKVDLMFKELLKTFDQCHLNFNIKDLNLIRIKYGIDEDETDETKQYTEDDSALSDHFSDLFETEDEQKVYVKNEVVEKSMRSPRKRGRPKGSVSKILRSTRQAKIKAEKLITSPKGESQKKKSSAVKQSVKRDKIKKDIRIRDRAERYRGPRSAREQPSTCEICSKTYTRKYMLTLHIREKHSKEELPYACQSCPKRFVTTQKLKVHEITHLPKEEKLIHPCPHCGKLYVSVQNVEIHIRSVHKNEKPFICEKCGKSFVTKGALKEHHISHSDERIFQCSHCSKKYKSLPRLKMHQDIHTTTLYECPTCGVKLNTKLNLKMHMLVHTEERKFKCKYCGNEFKRLKSFKDHLILHTGQKPYECPFCKRTFANGSNCRKHKKTVHPEELAALEASGEPVKITILPKLKVLQAKDV